MLNSLFEFTAVNVKTWFPWFCITALAVAIAFLYWSNQQQAFALAKLRFEKDDLGILHDTIRLPPTTPISPKEDVELEKLRGDNKDLPRLRNEVRQLRIEKADLNQRLLSAQSQRKSFVGTNVMVRFDSTVWKPVSSVNGSAYQSVTWGIPEPDWVQITVQNNPARKTEVEYKRNRLEAQEMRGQPADLIDERRETWGGRDWMVLDFRNSHTKPPRREISYFLPTEDGHATLFIVAEEASLGIHQEGIKSFLRQIQVK
jgi:hypothetical protein